MWTIRWACSDIIDSDTVQIQQESGTLDTSRSPYTFWVPFAQPEDGFMSEESFTVGVTAFYTELEARKGVAALYLRETTRIEEKIRRLQQASYKIGIAREIVVSDLIISGVFRQPPPIVGE